MSSAREQTPSQPKLSELLNAIEVARRNWKDWQEVFEHGFDIWTNPLLTNSGMFNKFVRDYSVGRTIRKGNQDSFRRKLSMLQSSVRPLRIIRENSCIR